MESKNIHHANIIVGKDCHNFVFGILEKELNFNFKANPDFLLMESQSLGIDDARNLARWVSGKPLLGEVKVSLIIVESITREAQNALLKVLEEPPLGTYIFINLESLGGLLPTFLSRVRILEVSKAAFDTSVVDKFLSSKIKGRISLIHSLSKKEDKDEMKNLIKDMERIAYRNNLRPQNLKDILVAKIFASAKGSSPKMLLEWLSCVLQ